MFDIFWSLIVGAIAGFLAGKIMRGRGFGLLGNVIVGVIGAFIGTIILGLFLIQLGGPVGSVIKATLGAVVFLWIASFFRRDTAVR
jgi:uncharacterized membrane protein YeaQ/YmgE (transglycosylase-associated protein family)